MSGAVDGPRDRDARAAARRDGRAPEPGDIPARVQQIGIRQQRFERALRESLHVDQPGLEAMDHLISSGPATPTELARRVDVSTAAMTLVLNRLEEAGHVRRERHPSDGRKLVVTAEQASADHAYALLRPVIDGVDALAAALGPAERAAVETFLDRLIAVYDAGLGPG